VEASALGGSRAACVAALLKELNDSVAGAFVEEEPAKLVWDPEFFKAFTIVIATQARFARRSRFASLTANTQRSFLKH